MKTNLLLVSLLFVFFSCSDLKKNEPGDTRASATATDSVSRLRIDSLLSIPDESINQQPGFNPCDPKNRQILLVNSFIVFHSNDWEQSSTNKINTGRCILLRGKNSPSSCKFFSQAYLHFVKEKKELRPPSFSYITKGTDTLYAELRLFYLEDYFDGLVMELNSSKDIFCWRGVFGDGYVYGDVHIGHTLPDPGCCLQGACPDADKPCKKPCDGGKPCLKPCRK